MASISGRWRAAAVGAVLLWALGAAAAAQALTCGPVARLSGGQSYARDEFVIHYAVAGKHALADAADGNGNGVPDAVEDVMTQLQTMREALAHLGFVHPFEQPRYRSRGVRHIHVRMVAMKANGLAFDEPRMYPRAGCGLSINVASHLKRGNVTPGHELFHLYQYGYTMFRRAWLLEGTARWAETILRRRPAETAAMPQTDEELDRLFRSSYSAVKVWNGLLQESGAPAVSAFPPAVRDARYVDGRPVQPEGTVVQGPAFVRAVLETLGEADAKVGVRRSVPAYRWPESMQRDTRHDRLIWDAVERTLNRFRASRGAKP